MKQSWANGAAGGPDRAPAPQPAWVNWLSGLPGVTLAFLWGLAEGTFFFVVPDVVITLTAMIEPRRAWRHILAAVAGSVLGGAIMFNWAVRDAPGANRAVARVPFVTARMFAEAHASYRKHGLGAVYLGPLGGIPYKIYAVEAPEFMGRARFLLATIPARGERFVFLWGFFGAMGALLRRTLRRTPLQLAARHAALWVLFYGVYWSIVVFR